jgi:hypothetical protein
MRSTIGRLQMATCISPNEDNCQLLPIHRDQPLNFDLKGHCTFIHKKALI